MIGVVAGALCALAIACASSQKAGMAPPPASVTPSAEMGRGTPKEQIQELDRQIAQAREQMGLGAQGPMPAPMAPACVGEACPSAQQMSADCHPGASETCTSSCNFKESICTNAKKICELAGQLPGDQWATDRCNAGQASCKEATDRCCKCQ